MSNTKNNYRAGNTLQDICWSFTRRKHDVPNSSCFSPPHITIVLNVFTAQHKDVKHNKIIITIPKLSNTKQSVVFMVLYQLAKVENPKNDDIQQDRPHSHRKDINYSSTELK